MKDRTIYQGIIPAFYACYDDNGDVSKERTKLLTEHLLKKGVKGVYVGGSSGECIYQGVEERKEVLEAVMEVAKGKMTVIAHVACNNTSDSRELASHAESLGVDAIASIPPIYFKLPPHAIAEYWNDISAAAPNTDFIIYNIPQLAGVALTIPLYKEMLKNPRVIGVKNSSMPVQDIQEFKMYGGKDIVVFNGPDEQLVSGLAMGADGGIGGTYAIMPELYIKIFNLCKEEKYETARDIQYDVDEIIYEMCAGVGNMYAVIKEILRIREDIDLGGVRKPLMNIVSEDSVHINKCVDLINKAIEKYC